jgi:hypothetical protein
MGKPLPTAPVPGTPPRSGPGFRVPDRRAARQIRISIPLWILLPVLVFLVFVALATGLWWLQEPPGEGHAVVASRFADYVVMGDKQDKDAPEDERTGYAQAYDMLGGELRESLTFADFCGPLLRATHRHGPISTIDEGRATGGSRSVRYLFKLGLADPNLGQDERVPFDLEIVLCRNGTTWEPVSFRFERSAEE